MGFRSLQTLVEHADPLVFLSFAVFFYEPKLIIPIRLLLNLILDSVTFKSTLCSIAQMAELVDAHGSDTCALEGGGLTTLLNKTCQLDISTHFFLQCYMEPKPNKASHPAYVLAIHLNLYYKSDRQN